MTSKRGASGAEDTERGTSVLTKKQRRHLLGKADIEEGSSADRAIRSRIRQRVYDAFLDFTLLLSYLPEADRERLVVSRSDEGWADFSTGVGDAVSLIYLLSDSEKEFEDTIGWGVRNGEAKRGSVENALNVGVTVDIVRPDMDLEEVAELLDQEEYHRIPPSAMMRFLWSLTKAGEFDPIQSYQEYEEWKDHQKNSNAQ